MSLHKAQRTCTPAPCPHLDEPVSSLLPHLCTHMLRSHTCVTLHSQPHLGTCSGPTRLSGVPPSSTLTAFPTVPEYRDNLSTLVSTCTASPAHLRTCSGPTRLSGVPPSSTLTAFPTMPEYSDFSTMLVQLQGHPFQEARDGLWVCERGGVQCERGQGRLGQHACRGGRSSREGWT